MYLQQVHDQNYADILVLRQVKYRKQNIVIHGEIFAILASGKNHN